MTTYQLNSTQLLSRSAQDFAAIYLLWHGVVKVALATALLLKRRWAYSHTHALELLVLSVADVFVIAFTWLEYQRLRTAHAFS